MLFTGGLGEAVCSAVAEEKDTVVRKLAVSGVPRSGKAAELMEMFAINANAVCKAVRDLVE